MTERPRVVKVICETRSFYEVEIELDEDGDGASVLDSSDWYEVLPKEPFDNDGPFWHVPDDPENGSPIWDATKIERNYRSGEPGREFVMHFGGSEPIFGATQAEVLMAFFEREVSYERLSS